MPSSKTFKDSSRERLPASSWLTICSSRLRQSSNLRSVIMLLRPLHAALETAPGQQHLDGIAGRQAGRVAYDVAPRRPREAVAAAEYGQRRQRVEASDESPHPMLGAYQRAGQLAHEP